MNSQDDNTPDRAPEEAAEATLTPAPDAGPTPGPSPGEMLRQAREAVGRSQADVAEAARLPQAILAALECDDFETLKEPVYVRGYYRKCAQILDIDPEPVVCAYEAKARPAAPALPDKIPIVAGGGVSIFRRLLRLLLILLLIVAAVLALRWMFSGGTEIDSIGGELPGLDQPDAKAMPLTPAEDSDSAAADGAASPSAPAAAQSGAPTAAPEAGTARPSADEAEGTADAAEAPATAAGRPVLELRFSEDSWLRVRDASGRSLENELVRGGQSRRFERAPPLEVFLGYAPGVEVRWQGEVVALDDVTRSNNTALLTLE